ncbi:MULTISPECIES: response regulator transcription factor [unclassified Paenibacillus]|uniref:response regulator transcription factor n=1 Tax=unclassified Paenibacillus TaxID=185978 RepID=UPI0003E1ED54|nr:MULTISPECIES: response regulator transcription factor [unclassified Paenibacillus]ETT33630.1 two-component response regulator [Paenibacillus sp. FSL R7-269]OMF95441.1 DNA-binding response regulator [Paenibacillus sp. FSL R7-0337]
MQSILIVEDEEAIARVLSAYLRKAGFHVTRAADGRSALDTFEEAPPSLVLLDIMLPEMDGFELLQLIRERSSCPVIMLTARDGINDRLAGLDGGADDYMSKPFIPEEVVARVKAVLRRPSQWSDGSRKRHFGSLFIDFSARSIFLNGAEVSLSPRDMSVLLFLAERPNQICTRDQLLEHVWEMDYDGSDRAVDLSIKRLRQALSHWPEREGEIRTLRGTGYQLWTT